MQSPNKLAEPGRLLILRLAAPWRFLFFSLSPHLHCAPMKYSRKRRKNNYRRDYSRGKIGDTLRHIYTAKAENVRQEKAERDKYHYLSRYGKQQRGTRLTERDIDILKRHLHEKHDRPHKKQRAVLSDYLGDRLARREQMRIYLRHCH